MIFKIQRPIASSEPLMYVYNEDRDISFFAPLEAFESWFEEDDLKIYVEAEYIMKDKYHDITITKKIEDQPW